MTDSTQPPEASSDPSPADEDGPDTDKGSEGGSDEGSGIGDDALPEDVQPGEDNPLAEPLDPDAEETKDADELAMDATQGDDDGDDEDSGDASDDDSDDGSDIGEPVGTASGTSDGPDVDAAGGGSAEDESQA